MAVCKSNNVENITPTCNSTRVTIDVARWTQHACAELKKEALASSCMVRLCH